MAKSSYRTVKKAEPTPNEVLVPIPEPTDDADKTILVPIPGPTVSAKPVKQSSGKKTAGSQTPRKSTRVDTPPSRFAELRANGLQFVNGVVDAFDDAFARLDAHEERLDDHGRQIADLGNQVNGLKAQVTELKERPTPEPSRGEDVTITIKVTGGKVKIE